MSTATTTNIKKARWRPVLLAFFYILVMAVATKLLFYVGVQTHYPTADYHLILSPLEYGDSGQGSLWHEIKGRIQVQPFNLVSFVIFCLAILHIFFARTFANFAERLKNRNSSRNIEPAETFLVELFRFMGEVEVVFGLWVIPLMIAMTAMYDWRTSINYLNGRNYTEAIFVFVIMVLASTRPIVRLAEDCLKCIAQLGGSTVRAWWLSILTIGPLLGSFITEPAAMTISAILLCHQFYRLKPTPKFAYATMGLLFTNISVGGVLTNFAAPPVLMVSRPWEWSSYYMVSHFGWKAVIGIIFTNIAYFLIFRKELGLLEQKKKCDVETKDQGKPIPLGISLVHVFFMAWIVVHANYPIIFIGSFLLFLGFLKATAPHQQPIHLKTPLLVGFFLAGLIVHGTLQAWWMSPILERATGEVLMILCIVLTAFNDNAEITFLASLTPTFNEALKYAVMAGAVTGGGLTVIANAPNLLGQSILSQYFKQGVSVIGLFLAALFPTIVMALSFYLLRNI